MKFSIDKEIFQRWPEVRVGVLVLRGIANGGKSKKITEALRGAEEKGKGELQNIDFGELPETAVWRQVYREFGSDPHDYRSSVEALLRRVKAGKPLPEINKLVDLYNYLSIKYRIPAGAEDLDKVEGDISLTIASGEEKGKYIGGDEVESAYAGEVIYKDDGGFICRRWNWREGDRTKIDEETTNAVLVFELLPSVEQRALEEALSEAKEMVGSELGGEVEEFLMSSSNPKISIEFRTGTRAVGKVDETVSKKMPHGRERRKSENTREKEFGHVKGTIGWQLASEIAKTVNGLWESQNITPEHVSIEHPTVDEHGDYSSNVALQLSKVLNKSPREVAMSIVSVLEQNMSGNLSEGIRIWEKIEVAGPGFINFWLDSDFLMSETGTILETKENYGKGKIWEGKKVMLEFTDPNPFKEFHIGHIYTNTVGESLARLFESQGAEVWRVNYEGDVGLHVAKAMWGMQVLASQMPSDDAPDSAKARFMGQAYALGAKTYEENDQVKAEIDLLNKKIYDRDPEVVELYEKGKLWSLDYFERIYRTLGMKSRREGKVFDRYYFESEAGEVGKRLVKDNLGKVFEESDGAVIFQGEKYGLHNRVFINSQGLPTYEAKEIGLAPTKYKDFPYDLSLIITGNEINEYFRVLIKALAFIYPELASRTVHVGHGMVRLPEGKMSSRTGKVLTGEWLIQQAEQLAAKRLTESKVRSTGEGREKNVEGGTSQDIGIAAIKYAFLRSSIGSDIEFDLDKSVDFEGDSGPYLQYTYARASSVLRKGGRLAQMEDTDNTILVKEELALLRWFYRFPEVVREATRQFAPNLLCSYLFELAKRYNAFYNEVQIIGSDRELFRLNLTKASAQVLQNGLVLLVIEPLMSM